MLLVICVYVILLFFLLAEVEGLKLDLRQTKTIMGAMKRGKLF